MVLGRNKRQKGNEKQVKAEKNRPQNRFQQRGKNLECFRTNMEGTERGQKWESEKKEREWEKEKEEGRTRLGKILRIVWSVLPKGNDEEHWIIKETKETNLWGERSLFLGGCWVGDWLILSFHWQAPNGGSTHCLSHNHLSFFICPLPLSLSLSKRRNQSMLWLHCTGDENEDSPPFLFPCFGKTHNAKPRKHLSSEKEKSLLIMKRERERV